MNRTPPLQPIYCVNAYLSDTSAVAVKFDESKIAVAGSPDNWVAKELCDLIDVALKSDLATPTHLQLLRLCGNPDIEHFSKVDEEFPLFDTCPPAWRQPPSPFCAKLPRSTRSANWSIS